MTEGRSPHASSPASVASPTAKPSASASPQVLAADSATPRARPRAVTPRVVFLCLALSLFFGYTIPVVDYKFSNTFLGATHLAPGAIGVILAMVVIVNPLLQVLGGPRFRFSRDEVLVIYLSCLFSCLIPGIGGNNYFTSFIVGSFYYATRENGWMEFLLKLPHWMTPALNADGSYNARLVEGWYVGLKPGEHIPWAQWALPLLAWGALMLSSFWTLCCAAVLLRAQWGDREALSFPLLRLPLELTSHLDEPASGRRARLFPAFFSERTMWIGFAIAILIEGLNGLHGYFPDVPQISTSVDTGALFTEAPWNQMGNPPIRIWPIAIGITFLLPSEISFSLWFFYWFMKAQLVVAYYLGFVPNALPNGIMSGQKLFTGYQEVGAHLAFVALILWTAREHFAHVWRRSIGREPKSEAEKLEVLSYPVAFWGFWLGLAFMVAWAVHAGVSVGLAIVLWLSWLVIAIVLSRVVAAGGLLFVHHSWMPLGAWGQLVGTGPGTPLSPANGIVPAAIIEYSMVQDYRASLAPSFVQSWKLAYDRGISGRQIGLLIGAVTLVTFIVGLQMNVRLGYDNGGLGLQGWIKQWGPQGTARNAEMLSRAAPDVVWTNWLWLAFGAALTVALTVARAHFAWFPLHPLGYMMALSYPMNVLWFSMFVGWLCKTLVNRFGGHDTYQKLVPAFLGLALGDVSMMLLWLIIDGWQGRSGHQLMPG